MKSGIVYGNAACLDGMISKIEEEIEGKATIIATGGLSHVIVPHCEREIIMDDALILKGLILIYKMNMDKRKK